ncbi:hypothetical protein FJY84_05715, partial [Candidatus Bathyarchaeota archaeon]|nr:hypothetical protein [Candidatus Bathyarchaeota archaeon]
MVEQELINTLQSISYIAGATGVCIAAIYYVITLRNSEKIKRRDLVFQRLQVPMQQHYDAFYTVMKMTDWKTTEEFERKYGYWMDQNKFTKFMYIINHFNALGILYKDGIATAEQIFQLYLPMVIIQLYEKFEPMIQSRRIASSGGVLNPDAWKPFEMLYLEAKRRYPDIPPMANSFEET